jgi:hypothetical protein
MSSATPIPPILPASIRDRHHALRAQPGNYRPAVVACVRQCEASSNRQIDATIKLLNKALGMLVLETLSVKDLAALIRELRVGGV